MSYLQMLELADRQTARSLSVLDNAMSRELAIRQDNANRLENIALKNIELGEQRRMNEFRMAQSLAEMSLQKQRFEMDASLMPLRYQTEQLKLKAAQMQNSALERQNQVSLFDSIAGQYDAVIAGELIESNNPMLADEAIKYKNEWMEKSITGEQEFNGQLYLEGWKKRAEQIKQNPEYRINENYDSNIQQRIEVFGKPASAAYGIKYNPDVKNSRVAAGLSAVFGRGEVAQRTFGEYAHKFAADEHENIALMTSVVETNRDIIDRSGKAIEDLTEKLRSLEAAQVPKDDSRYLATKNQLNDVLSEYETARTQNAAIRANILKDNYTIPSTIDTSEVPAPAPERQINPNLDPTLETTRSATRTLHPWIMDKPLGVAVQSKLTAIENVFGINGDVEKFNATPLASVDYNMLVDNARNLTEDLELTIAKQVQQKSAGLKLNDDQQSQLISTAKAPVELRVSKTLEAAMKEIAPWRGSARHLTKRVQSTIDAASNLPPMSDITTMTAVVGNQFLNMPTNIVTISALGDEDARSKFASGFSINSPEDVKNILSKVPPSKRKAAEQELNSLLLSASLISAAR